jgi:nucleotide-binding universal stress UspA family protein
LPRAAQLASTLDGTLVLLRIVSDDLRRVTGTGFLAAPMLVTELLDRAETEAHDYVERMAQRLRRAGVRVQTVIEMGDVVKGILKESEVVGTSLILMTTHGRTGVDRWRLGSVAMSVVRNATSPVLLTLHKPVWPPVVNLPAPEAAV